MVKIIVITIVTLFIIGLIVMFYCIHRAPVYPDNYDL